MDESYRGTYRSSAMVMDYPGGAYACYGPSGAMYPPVCFGQTPPGRVRVVGWSWTGLTPSGQTPHLWAIVNLVGQYADGTFTITGPVTQGTATDPFPGRRWPLSTPCPTPAEGRAPVRPSVATLDASDLAATYAKAQNGFGAMWVDERNPAGVPYSRPYDPLTFVLNISTTGDTAALEHGIRQIWGGALCVSHTDHSAEQLQQVKAALEKDPLAVRVVTEEQTGQVRLEVLRATYQEQQKLDTQFGAGTVRLYGWLEPTS